MIEIATLTKSYNNSIIVDNLSLTVRKGAVFGFLGQNGSGKTTTIKMVVGLAIPDRGYILIRGKSSGDPSVRERIGFMPEAPYFYERLTGLEFLRFCGRMFRNQPGSDEKYNEILKEVGIYEFCRRPIATYSKGMKQRLAFAQAMVNDPEYLFLDEPLEGLDPLGRREIKRIIKKFKKEGRTVFLNSHILYDIEELCDDIGVIHDGKLLYSGSVRDFCVGRPLEEMFVARVENYQRQWGKTHSSSLT